MKRILIPVDGSPKSLEAVRATLRDGGGAIARIDLVNVQPLLSRHAARWLTREQRDGWRAERSAKALEKARRMVEMSAIPCATHAATGPVAAAVTALARQLRSHEIVVGASRRTLLGRLLANSTSTQLLETAEIPVRVIPVAPAPFIEALALPAGIGLLALFFFAGD